MSRPTTEPGANEPSVAERFVEAFERAAPSLSGHGVDWLDARRRSALERFAESGLPRSKDENWKYTSIRPIEKRRFEPVTDEQRDATGADVSALAFGDLDCHRVVLVNGRFSPELSDLGALPEGVSCRSLARALAEGDDTIQPYLAHDFAGSEEGFALLNTAFVADGVVIRVARGTRIDKPIHVLYLGAPREQALACNTRNIVVAEAGSELTLIEHYAGIGEHGHLTNAVNQIEARDNAKIEHLRVQDDSRKGFVIGRTDVAAARDARYRAYSIDLGGMLVRHDLNVRLTAEGGECSLRGLYVLSGRQHVDNHTRIDHEVGYTTSRELYKGVMDQRSRGVFNGKVWVHPGAAKSDSAQSNANLLLSKHAEVDTKPELEIYNDDVQCAHGSTVGQLDAQALYYLRSRGLSEGDARSLLVYAFCREIVDELPLKAVSERLRGDLLTRLPAGDAVKELV